MKNKIHSIAQLFPDFEDRIEFMFLHNESFRELCTDYIFCASKILDLKRELHQHRAEIEEYEGLQQQLEQEMLDLILENRINSQNSSLP